MIQSPPQSTQPRDLYKVRHSRRLKAKPPTTYDGGTLRSVFRTSLVLYSRLFTEHVYKTKKKDARLESRTCIKLCINYVCRRPRNHQRHGVNIGRAVNILPCIILLSENRNGNKIICRFDDFFTAIFCKIYYYN